MFVLIFLLTYIHHAITPCFTCFSFLIFTQKYKSSRLLNRQALHPSEQKYRITNITTNLNKKLSWNCSKYYGDNFRVNVLQRYTWAPETCAKLNLKKCNVSIWREKIQHMPRYTCERHTQTQARTRRMIWLGGCWDSLQIRRYLSLHIHGHIRAEYQRGCCCKTYRLQFLFFKKLQPLQTSPTACTDHRFLCRRFIHFIDWSHQFCQHFKTFLWLLRL